MTADPGRDCILYWGNESPIPAVAGINNFTVTVDGEAIDITNNDSSGWRELLTDEGVRGVTIQVSGVVLDDTLRADKLNGTNQQAAIFEWPDGSQISGTFHLNAYSDSGPHDNATTFEATFVSSGTVTYTPAA